MDIIRERKEEVLAKSIDYATKKSFPVLSVEQKEMDFDDQVMAALGHDQDMLRSAIERCSPNLIERSESAILDNASPTHVDQLLRVSLWEEFSEALVEGRQVSERAIYNGVCSYNYWKHLRDENEEKFTYLLIPVKSYSRTNKLLLTLGQEALINILEADAYVKSQGSGNKKQLDPKIAKVQLEAYKMIDERIHGKAVNRIQTHNTNENSPGNAQETLSSLQNEIKELEGKIIRTIDVEESVDD